MRHAPAAPCVAPPVTLADWRDSRRLVAEYAATLGVDLHFQDFAAELGNFEREYAASAGAFLLARDAGPAVGCVGLRRFDDDRGEIKRLYVVPAARGRGVGAALVDGIVAAGRRLGYPRLVLDTLPSMRAAQELYRRLGFRPVAPYRFNPVPGTVFLELALRD
jgi:putative acetyltransferase